mmetsp:Transcript_8522/g.21293  ORF Transcript_8522/g.21293 Transcript_8522/m.21293 type:complete len:497 (+) Transcript_8522:214-1704(+)|eukprot:CAMPEP_0206247494 /NCGR_PEP_ID=MMETSP0047_2-20121206/19838_1 /ASSEMBLY_ACC=CAM_ASM_000192 /TAXON_ID=195065 /ORGANISM="Chroomonas mesostigmatica_cf, Strain CCMP1168" /LENGTH=496 /DNA_ID=CAMNT_0053673019 /DNA_START=197 /DNA_END=1687 /DNA_ORIENTATION=-
MEAQQGPSACADAVLQPEDVFDESVVEGPRRGLQKQLPAGPVGSASPSSGPPSSATGSFTEPDGSDAGEPSLLDERRRRIWVHGPRPEYKKYGQRYNLPARVCSFLRPGLDVVILPGAHDLTREFWAFASAELGLEAWQAVFTEGGRYNLDDDVSNNDALVEALSSLVAGSGAWTLVPYCPTDNFNRWASTLMQVNADVRVYGESLEWVEKYGHKGCLHRHVRNLDVPSVVEQVCGSNVVVAKGYTCSTIEHLLEAYRLLECERVVIKPVFGAAGEGILFLKTEQELREYTFPMGDVCLEEHLDLDLAVDGICLSPALHYNEMNLLGNECVDQIMNGVSYLGWRKSEVPESFQAKAREGLLAFMRATCPRGPGGVDFLSVKGQPILSDLNTGRFNGAHTPKMFREMYAPGASFYCWKGRTPENLTVHEFWKLLEEEGLAFHPNKSTEGVWPLLYLRGRSFMFVALSKEYEDCASMRTRTDAILERASEQLKAPPST